MVARAKYWWKTFNSGGIQGIFAGLAAHSGQISVGLSQGFSAVLIPKLLETKFATVSEGSWIASLGVISNPIGALIAGSLAECFGRRSAIALATLPHMAGWLLIALSTNIPMLYVGRFISGIGTGMANGLYLYVSEAAAPHQRAWLASSGPVLVSFGVLMIYTLGALTTWQRTAAISIGPAILSLALTRMLPETPAWLATRGRVEEAKESLFWLRGPGISTENEYKELCSTNVIREKEKSTIIEALHSPRVWKPFLILFAFFALQQLSGIYVILFYAVTVLEDIGVKMDAYTGSVGLALVRLVASLLGVGLAGYFGRRTLACASAFGMAVSAGGVALSMRYDVPSWIPLVCVALHVGFSMIGYLTLPWVMTSELYPLRFRGAAGGLTTSIAQLMTFAAIKTYPDMSYSIGLEATMWTFACVALIGAAFAITVLPETRGRSLDQIECRFSGECEEMGGDQNPRSIVVPQPKNVTLKRFTSITEEKHSNMVTNAFAYDNFCLDLTNENSLKTQDELNLGKREWTPSTDTRIPVISTILLEHAYL
ncbi:facilitated trehalose transporter Tret1-like [Venturia canescens]|uniref:facilitated trehalose transporter Tret1-like n=1 Tax=Venturia canescens TaxID=32260 RepID=UPI001C9CD672|nr:facilitated trehalose transporter Tret1-like [Venturia canescens]XP_043280669.1 facilitated trehalose transporter Tret1-like [Venturia canescens]